MRNDARNNTPFPGSLCSGCPLAGRPQVSPDGPPDAAVALIGAFPIRAELMAGKPFGGGRAALLREVTAERLRGLSAGRAPAVAWACAVRCRPPEGKAALSPAQLAAVTARCSARLLTWLDRLAPRAVAAFGKDALAALGLRDAPGDGPLFLETGLGRRVPVVAAPHVLEAVETPGLRRTLAEAVDRALRLATDDFAHRPFRAFVPERAAAVAACLERTRADLARQARASGRPVHAALHLAVGEGDVLALALAWCPERALAVPLRHPAAPYSKDEARRVDQALGRLLSAPFLRLAVWDGKEACRRLRLDMGLPLPDPGYDALLAEHALNEDRGAYLLADTLTERFPSLAGEEDAWRRLVARVGAARTNPLRAGERNQGEGDAEAARRRWLALSKEERLERLAAWVEAGRLRLSETRALLAARGRMGKAAREALERATRDDRAARPPAPAPGGPDEAPALAHVPLRDLLRREARIALALRALTADQLRRFREDEERAAPMPLPDGRPPPSALAALHAVSLPVSLRLARMEHAGVRFDRDTAVRHLRGVEDAAASLHAELVRRIGHDFNPAASAPDLARVLYGDMGLPAPERAAGGEPATDAAALALLAREHDLPWLKDMTGLRRLLAARRALEAWLAASAGDGFIRPAFRQTATPTFRIGCARPNLQAVPLELPEAGLNLRELFVPDSPRFELYEADIAHADLRALAAYSRDEALIRSLRPGGDPHSLAAAALTPYSYDELILHRHEADGDLRAARQIGKTVNFGIVNGMGPAGLRRQLLIGPGLDVPEEACGRYLARYFAAHPGVAASIRDTRRFVEHHRFVTTFTGRRRRFPRSLHRRAEAARMVRQAVNFRLQATVADLTSLNLLDIRAAVAPLGGRVLLTVYDAVVFQLPRDAEGVGALLRKAVTGNTARRFPWLPVPWLCETRRGRDYGHLAPCV